MFSYRYGRNTGTPTIVMNNLQFLLSTMLFKGSSGEKIEHILELFQERELKPNTTIFIENMPAEALYIIKSGTVRISMMAGEGEEMGILLLGPGEFFGELALVQEANRLVTARAETAVELLLITRKDFQTLTELEPRIAARALMIITKLLAMRIRTYQERLKQQIVS
jgi:CRP-like cAMP-binding protein